MREFEWYVLNGRNGEVVFYNIFDNALVYDRTIKLCKQFKKDKMEFKEFVEELRQIIQCEEWGRYEYEILVTTWPPQKPIEDNLEKIDCYEQVLPNIDLVAKYVLETYYPRLKV